MKTAMSFRSCTAGELVSPNAGIDAAWTNTAVSSFRDKTFVFSMTCINSTIAFIVRQIVTNAFSRCALRRIGRFQNLIFELEQNARSAATNYTVLRIRRWVVMVNLASATQPQLVPFRLSFDWNVFFVSSRRSTTW